MVQESKEEVSAVNRSGCAFLDFGLGAHSPRGLIFGNRDGGRWRAVGFRNALQFWWAEKMAMFDLIRDSEASLQLFFDALLIGLSIGVSVPPALAMVG